MRKRVFKQIEPTNLKNTLFIVGMPGIALVGKLAVEAMIDQYDAIHVMDLFPKDLPPRVTIDATGIPEFMKISLYHAYDKACERDLFFLIGDIQPQSMDGQYEFAEYVSELAKKYKTTTLIACAASVTIYLQDEPLVRVVGNSKETIEFFTSHPKAEQFSEGTITGANGLIPTIAWKFYEIKSAILLADTTRLVEQVFNIDPKASKVLLEVLKDSYNLSINPSELDSKIEELNNLLKTLKSRAESAEKISEEREQSSTFIS
ncbi:MAG: PAC2 family protein [Candidatus Ranarchaeia archaeon]